MKEKFLKDSSHSNCDLFILAAEPSGDLHGAELIQELKKKDPSLSIHAVAGPRMRALNVSIAAVMEDLEVMGFFDVLIHFPKLLLLFYRLRKIILSLNPKVCVFIDYPEFHIRLERSLRKKNFKGKLIHYICPTVWAWGKHRIDIMAKNLDLLLTLFPFEPRSFDHTSLHVKYVGNPVISLLEKYSYMPSWKEKFQNYPLIALFPGSRVKEIQRNLPLQLKAAKELALFYPKQMVLVSLAQKKDEALLRKIIDENFPAVIIPPKENYDLMKHANLALATSGTVTLELALHQTPTVVTYSIRRWDQFLAQKVLKINLPFYCIVNILSQKEVFPELFGGNLTLERLVFEAKKLLDCEKTRQSSLEDCEKINEILKCSNPSSEAANFILKNMV